ncbi:AraC family transcriptional regulator [Schlegelella sp. S2-27]|uniref:AraC family transcriptional regulator n=1 Tax=Caldimonas mangrovi TaxID=2944811 RepID=A0ABT0YR33_9BURK|nr:AraC family transcriptional regulator [Caldimonas mangrovi]MCM5681189.1 AraC family transcriptional regulator [Caldimonas mangrovi]
MTPDTRPLPLPPPRAGRSLDSLAHVAAHIDRHLDAPLDTAELAALAGLSRHHFQRMFRACFGTTVQGYVTWRRLRRATELLADARLPVLEVALAVGYESAQALAKAMRRELDTTPTAARAGAGLRWQRLFDAAGGAQQQPTGLRPRLMELPALPVLTAAGHGIEGGEMRTAAAQAYGELMPALTRAGLMSKVRGYLALIPELPDGPDDPDCRFLGGVMFDAPPHLQDPLRGSLHWHELPAGGYAVFRHEGRCCDLHHLWAAIYRDWLPATRYALRDVPSFEVYVDAPNVRVDEGLRVDIHVPVH